MKRMPADDDMAQGIVRLRDTPDRTTAIVGSAYMEHGLKRVIIANCTSDSDGHENLFDDSRNGPLATFAARTKIAFAFGAIDAVLKADLDCIRHIRNAFAHTADHIEFTEPEIQAECAKLSQYERATSVELKGRKPRMSPPKAAFVITIGMAYAGLLAYAANPIIRRKHAPTPLP